jgi:hypothetical protein
MSKGERHIIESLENKWKQLDDVLKNRLQNLLHYLLFRIPRFNSGYDEDEGNAM